MDSVNSYRERFCVGLFRLVLILLLTNSCFAATATLPGGTDACSGTALVSTQPGLRYHSSVLIDAPAPWGIIAGAVVSNPDCSFAVAGTFNGTNVDLNPYSGVDLFSVPGSQLSADVFLTKFNADRTYGWTKQIGSTGSDSVKGLISDDAQNYYVLGKSNGAIFVKSYGEDGSDRWRKDIDSTDREIPYELTYNVVTNEIIVVGSFNATLRVDNSEIVSVSAGDDAFIARLNAATGALADLHGFGGSGEDIARAITVDAGGNIYIGGSFRSTQLMDFDPGIESTSSPGAMGQADLFVLKLDPDANYLWHKVAGGSGLEYVDALAAIGDSIYAGGTFGGSVNFNPEGTDTHQPTPGDLTDMFITRRDSDGEYLSTQILGDVCLPGAPCSSELVYSMVTSPRGNLLVSGSTSGQNGGRNFVSGFSPSVALKYTYVVKGSAWSSGPGTRIISVGAISHQNNSQTDLNPTQGTDLFNPRGPLGGFITILTEK